MFRKWLVNLPLGIERFMHKTSRVAFWGIRRWADAIAKVQGLLDEQEIISIHYVRTFKDPVDEVAVFLKSLSRIDRLAIIFSLGLACNISLEYLVEQFYGIMSVRKIVFLLKANVSSKAQWAQSRVTIRIDTE